MRLRALGSTFAVITALGGCGGSGRSLEVVPQTTAAIESANGERASIDHDGAHVSLATGGAPVGVVLRAFGRSGDVREVDAPTVSRVGSEVRLHRAACPGVTEWWRVLSAGLEHGVTFDARPGGSGPLVLEVEIDGLELRGGERTDAVALVGDGGEVIGSYSGLTVVDASGDRVPAVMAAIDGRVRIVVDDEDARYPLIVDPLVTAVEASVVPAALANGMRHGQSVALSADGSRALIGAPDPRASCPAFGACTYFSPGYARVFLRTGTTWAEETTLGSPTPVLGEGWGGAGLALSADGSLAFVGGPATDTTAGANAGAVDVFTRSGAVWSPAGRIVASDGAANDQFGQSLAVTPDGTRLVVGAHRATVGGVADSGRIYVFALVGAAWVEEASLTTAGGGRFGHSVAISGDGNFVVGGAPYAESEQGQATVFSRRTGTWALHGPLPATGRIALERFGSSVALDADGTRALVGAIQVQTCSFGCTGGGPGNVRIFVRAGDTWAEEARVTNVGGTTNAYFGNAISVNADASLALVGAHREPVGGVRSGAAYLFARAGTTWAQAAELVAPGSAADDYLGDAVALSGDSARALVGAPEDDTPGGTTAGNAWVFSIRAGQGETCRADENCTTAFCVDGVCCDSACGGGAVDCLGCSAALTGGSDGTCDTLSAAVAPTVVCRAAAGPCDLDDVCDSSSPGCPDGLASAGTECRAVAGVCDVSESCDGATVDCPADAFVTGVSCRSVSGPCDVEESCDGSGAVCPTDLVRATGEVCLAAAGECDADDLCDGTTADCAPLFAPDTAPCGTLAGVCDGMDHCAGTDASCVAVVLSGSECRASAGVCDAPELCDGSSTDCPADALATGTVVCRASTESCDPEETCSGADVTCPADLRDCASPDGGRGDGGAITTGDGGGSDVGPRDAATVDGGTSAVEATGCACRSGRRSISPAGGLGLFLVALGVWRRRSSPRAGAARKVTACR